MPDHSTVELLGVSLPMAAISAAGGGVILVCCCCSVLLLVCCRRRRKAKAQRTAQEAGEQLKVGRPSINRVAQRRSTRYNTMREESCELSGAMPAPSAQPQIAKGLDLPVDWKLHTTEAGEQYYFNHLTGESQWTKPEMPQTWASL